VYADTSQIGIGEDAPVAVAPDPTTEDVPAHYGALKALCEQAVEKAMPGRTTVVRPGLIVGPGDGSDRFSYWPVRIAAGGEVLAPGDPTTPVQFIDVRDLAELILNAIEGGHVGVYNGTGAPIPMGDLLTRSKAALNSNAEFTWVSREFLAEKEVQPWSDLPVWLPPDPGLEGAATVKIDRALAIGLKFRPLEETVTSTVAWFNTLPEPRRAKMRAGLTREREAELLAAWHKLHPAPGKAKPKPKKKAA
jgi:2'-hydroxyisoflavone reductase